VVAGLFQFPVRILKPETDNYPTACTRTALLLTSKKKKERTALLFLVSNAGHPSQKEKEKENERRPSGSSNRKVWRTHSGHGTHARAYGTVSAGGSSHGQANGTAAQKQTAPASGRVPRCLFRLRRPSAAGGGRTCVHVHGLASASDDRGSGKARTP
jgi:hypothetical protein